MTTKPIIQPEDRLQTVCDAFDGWRSSRRKGSPIPAHLWDAAVSLSPVYSTYRIARALKLDYMKLKRLINDKTSHDRPPGFFELKHESFLTAGQCTIHLHNPKGFRMEIRAQGALPSQLLPLVTAFLEESR